MSGSVNTLSTLFIAVSVMFRATSPRAMWLKMFADAPPGAAERSMRPTARSGGNAKSFAMPNAAIGNRTI